MSNTIDSLNKDKIKMSNTINSLTKENLQMSNTIDFLTKDNLQMSNTIDSLNKDKEFQLRQANDKYNNLSKVKYDEIREWSGMNQKHLAQISARDTEIKKMNVSMEKYKTSIGEWIQQTEQLKNANIQLKQTNTVQTKRIDDLNRQIAELRASLNSYKN
ncbi:hypothetical protein DFA_11475 [Cavenderia fasciculata]|uniref:Uncharacterized protein n=1 Tax=Cavenderia fasciculata TaxID=261658 RepID=F4QD33_CACFS|nr:uncharacterized protein DFA_11475 [Cavenderia fasciculata]EGG13714.1 hypothetical protein DFA_11475 [Cavenderia fasciculata]|eukprot:XP_004350418.1 hypothetical protein DFA_11475 [Cavenderia fasciculata]